MSFQTVYLFVSTAEHERRFWNSIGTCCWFLFGTGVFPQAPKLKLGLITSTWLNLKNSKIFTILHHPYCCYIYIYTLYNLFAHSSCTYLLVLFIKYFYYIAHLILYFFFFKCFTYIYVYSLVLQYFALSIERTWPDLHFTTDYTLYNWVPDE